MNIICIKWKIISLKFSYTRLKFNFTNDIQFHNTEFDLHLSEIEFHMSEVDLEKYSKGNINFFYPYNFQHTSKLRSRGERGTTVMGIDPNSDYVS